MQFSVNINTRLLNFISNYGHYFYNIDNQAAIEKYNKLKELGEKYPFRDKEINKDNLKEAIKAATKKADVVTTVIINSEELRKYDTNSLTAIAKMLFTRFGFFQEAKKFVQESKEMGTQNANNSIGFMGSLIAQRVMEQTTERVPN